METPEEFLIKSKVALVDQVNQINIALFQIAIITRTLVPHLSFRAFEIVSAIKNYFRP